MVTTYFFNIDRCRLVNLCEHRFIMIGRINFIMKQNIHDSTLIKLINNHESKTIVVDYMMMCHLGREDEEGTH